ncbi:MULTISPECIES: glycoside hydrolase family 43 protein [unclassified Streptomyces]|uniref:glycoside hydrolase family 43 protein n=1 Tax=unclassified Streptomyces TaxID=2593676 RepID=UPI0038008227
MTRSDGTGEADAGFAAAAPVLPGCHPDPSVCRVGDDHYLITSTFEYFPGIPVFHSRDLLHWRPIGHVLDRTSQVDLGPVASSQGIFAATIRHHEGRFWVITTLVGGAGGTGRNGTFAVHATDPAGPWSDPVWLDDAPGIDPSLFFDDDGRAWCTGTRLAEPGEWEGQTDVWLREFDPVAIALTGPEHLLWRGALHGAVWAEGPHLYKADGRYYLLAAEGGTEHRHAVSVARADHVTGPWTGNPANPVFTHRHLGRDFPVVGVGHADLVHTAAGEWWAVLLGSRPYGGYHPNLGRETFLVPVTWEDGWPVFAPGVGTTLGPFRRPRTTGPAGEPYEEPVRDDFDGPALRPSWNQVRTGAPFWSLTARPGSLRLPLGPASLADTATPCFLGRRQQHQQVSVSALFDVAPRTPGEWAGLAVRQSEADHLVLAVAGDGRGGRRVLAAVREHGAQRIVAEAPLPEGPVVLRIHAEGQRYGLRYAPAGAGAGPRETELAVVDGGFLSSPRAGGFLGVWLGPYATAHGAASATAADVDWFDYQPLTA